MIVALSLSSKSMLDLLLELGPAQSLKNVCARRYSAWHTLCEAASPYRGDTGLPHLKYLLLRVPDRDR